MNIQNEKIKRDINLNHSCDKECFQKQKDNQNKNSNKNQIILLTISAPLVNKKRRGFKSSIASSFFTDEFTLNPDDLLQRMYYLKLKRFKLFCVSKTEIFNNSL